VTKDNADHFLRKFVETHDPLNSENVNVTTRNRTHAAISHERPKKKTARKTSVQKTTKIGNCANERQNEQRNERPKRTTKPTAKRTTKTNDETNGETNNETNNENVLCEEGSRTTCRQRTTKLCLKNFEVERTIIHGSPPCEQRYISKTYENV
jgi:hypothetical protein